MSKTDVDVLPVVETKTQQPAKIKLDITADLMCEILYAALGKMVDPKFIRLVVGISYDENFIKQYKDLKESGVSDQSLLDMIKPAPIFVIEICGIKWVYSINMMNKHMNEMKQKKVNYICDGITYFTNEWHFFGFSAWNGEKLPKSTDFAFMYVEKIGLYYTDHTNKLTVMFPFGADIVEFAESQRDDIKLLDKDENLQNEATRKIFIQPEWHREMIRIIRFMNSGKPNLVIYIGPGSVYTE